MNQGKICVSICGETTNEVLGRIERARQLADVIEIRFDCLHPEEIEPLIEKLATRTEQFLITFRPAGQGGTREITINERTEFWEKVASRLDDTPLLDIEYDLEFPQGIDAKRIIVSRHEFSGRPDNLDDVFEGLFLRGSGAIKLAVNVTDASDAVDVYTLLNVIGRPVVPIAMGEAGKWTRILGLAHNAWLTYASLDATEGTAPGQIAAEDLHNVFRVKELDRRSNVYAVIAGDTSYSLSPFMHNAAFKLAALNSVFVPMQVHDLDAFMRRMVFGATREVEMNFKGFSVTNPHKQSVIKYLDSIDETARKIGAVNTIKIESGKLRGFNTDALGFIKPLKDLYGDLRDACVLVAGAGGASRACIYALKQEGADVTLFARDLEKATTLADEFGVEVRQLSTDHRPLTADILVNTTPVGTIGESLGESIATSDELRGVKLVYDLVYNPEETRLIREAKMAGSKTLGGIEMLIAQGAQQFSIWTGEDPPVDEMKAAVNARLNQTYAR
ncbi:MAG: shikimate dehydrogenase [Acidobacteriota bacterium]